MNTYFHDRTVLITGGGTGIGRAVARAFGRAGADVVVTGRTGDTLRDTQQAIHAEGGTATAVPADVTDPSSLGALMDRVLADHGGVDIAVNSAGTMTATGPVGAVDLDEWDRLLAVNLTGVLRSMRGEIAQMRRLGGGAIVNVSSTLGAHRRVAGLGAYAATKAAVSALTRAAALDHIGDGIRINAISPGPVDTPGSYRPGESRDDRDDRLRATLPVGRVGTLDEVAAAVLYLASPEAGFLVGTDLVLDGGSTA